MSNDRRLFIRYFNATFLCVCPSTSTFWSSVSIVNSRLVTSNRLCRENLIFGSVKIAEWLSQQIVHNSGRYYMNQDKGRVPYIAISYRLIPSVGMATRSQLVLCAFICWLERRRPPASNPVFLQWFSRTTSIFWKPTSPFSKVQFTPLGYWAHIKNGAFV